MKEFKALQSVLSTLGVNSMSENVCYEGIEKAFYSIRIATGSVSLQGVYSPNIAGWIVTKFPSTTSNVNDTGYVGLEFEYDGVAFRICLT